MSHWPKTTTTLNLNLKSETDSGFADGQEYIDALAETAAAAGVASLATTRAAILEELDRATDFDDLRRRLRARYRSLDPEETVELVHRATVLAALAGERAVQQDQG